MQYLLENYKSHIHYNSSEPKKFGLKAFTKGGEIHLSSGAEDSIGHELGHVVQQKTKNITATVKIGKEKVNLDPKLEKEADEIANHIENYVPEIVSEDINKTKDVVQFEYDPQNPGAWQEQRRDYYKDKSFVIDRVLNVQNDISLVDRCTNVEQINTMLKNILASYWGDNPKDHVVNLDTMDLDLAKANAKQLIYLFSKYSTSIHDITMERLLPSDRRSGARASVSGEFLPSGGRTLSFHNPFFVTDSETIGSAVLQFAGGERNQIENGNHAEIRTKDEIISKAGEDMYLSEIEKLLKYTITHEFGHSILSYDSLDKKVRFDSMCGSVDETQRKIRSSVLALYDEYLKKYGSRFSPVNPKRERIPPQAHTRKSEPTNFISEYAGRSEEEFIAECFVQAQLSPTPSIYAIKMMEILDAYFAWNPEIKWAARAQEVD